MSIKVVLKIIDANANRAREGIRTAEDYIRFGVGHRSWSSKLREIRHQVAQAMSGANDLSIALRNVKQDPGNAEQSDHDNWQTKCEGPIEVAVRGLKRAQEALRVLEEFSKSPFPESSKTYGRLRFELYEAEQWLVCGARNFQILQDASLYVLITEALCLERWDKVARAAVRGGARLLQLREKQLEASELVRRAGILKEICNEFGALCVVNDRADVAAAAGVQGVHLGQRDLPTNLVRNCLGAEVILGKSTHSLEQAVKAEAAFEIDYLAIGAMYQTQTKQHATVTGLELARGVLASEIEKPVFAIGGITLDRIPELKEAGVKRVAVSKAVLSERDPEAAAKRLVDALATQANTTRK